MKTHLLCLVVQCEDNLLELNSVASILPSTKPFPLRRSCPVRVNKSNVGRSECRRDGGSKERRVLDAVKDVEVCEGGEDEDEDDGFYGREYGVDRQRAQ